MKDPLKPRIKIYSDGSAQPNPGRGGWAAIIIRADHVTTLTGSEHPSTSNRMELKAIVEALRHIDEPSTVWIYSDSTYATLARRKAWRLKMLDEGCPNRDLWTQLAPLLDQHTIHWHHVSAHTGIRLNEEVDQLAKEAAKHS